MLVTGLVLLSQHSDSAGLRSWQGKKASMGSPESKLMQCDPVTSPPLSSIADSSPVGPEGATMLTVVIQSSVTALSSPRLSTSSLLLVQIPPILRNQL